MQKSKITGFVLIFSLLMTLCYGAVPAFSAVSGDWQYTLNSDGETCTINKYTGTATTISIPSTLDRYTVTELAISPGPITTLFKNNTSVKEVNIPSTVLKIGESAFFDCSKLTKVTIPSSVTSVGNNAFLGCVALTEITLPSNLTSIGDNAFSMCLKLDNLTLPSNLMSIGNSAFNTCISLSSITIPSNVTIIGESTFKGCNQLKSVNFSPNISEIGKNAFKGCCGLIRIDLPLKLTKIGYGAFSDCSQLSSVTIPAGVTKLDYYAFKACTALKYIYFDGSVDISYKEVFNGISPDAKYYAPAGNVIEGVAITAVPTYTVTTGAAINGIFTSGAAVNGRIFPSTSQGMAGETITLDVVPDSDCIFQSGSLSYTDGSDTVAINNNAFVMPDKPIQITGTFIQMEAPQVASPVVTANSVQWTWKGNSGLSDVRYKLTTPDSNSADWQYTGTESLETASQNAGYYSLEIQVKYNEENWSPSAVSTVSVERINPEVTEITPNGTAVALVTSQVVLVFSETVTTSSGSISITDGIQSYSFNVKDQSSIISGTDTGCKAVMPTAGFVSADGKALTIGRGKTYAVSVSAGAFVDPCGNEIASNSHLGSFTSENPSYAVTYNGNGSTSGTVPTDSKLYHLDETVTVLGANTLAKTDFTFAGWSTFADGTGTVYQASNVFAMGIQNVTLYAKWTAKSVSPVTPPSKDRDHDTPSDQRPSNTVISNIPQPSNNTSPVIPNISNNTPTEKKAEQVTPKQPLKLKVVVNSAGKGTLKVTLAEIQGLLDEAIKNKAKQLIVPLEMPKSVKGLQLQIEPALVKAMNRSGIKTLTFKTDLVSYSFEQKTLVVMEKQAAKGINVSLERQEIKVDTKLKTSFKITSSVPGSSMKITQSYTLSKGEKPTDILLFVVNADKKEERIKSVTYDAKNKNISFVITVR